MSTDSAITTSDDADIWGGIATDEAPATTPSLPQADGPKGVHDAIIFDIETGPLPDAELWKVVPPFDPASLVPFGERHRDYVCGRPADAVVQVGLRVVCP